MGMFTVTSEIRDNVKRSWTTRHIIHDDALAVKEYDDEPAYRPALDITTSHDKDRKMLVTSITRIMLNGRIVRWHMELRDSDPLPWDISPRVGVKVARYSAKALEERHALILDNLTPYRESLIEWASRAKV